MSKLLFLGDFYYNYENIEKDIDEISKFISDNGYKTIVNLEGSLCQTENKIEKRGPNLFQSRVAVEVLKRLNTVGVTLSNNHIMDFGSKGLSETIKILEENNIQYCGAGINIENAMKPIELNIDDKVIRILNYGWNIEETVYATKEQSGCSPRIEENIIENIKKYRESTDILINIMHWGFEYNLYPMPFDIKLAHNMIDNGVDLIIGHHPHVIQSKETYKNKKIYYSLGNFYFSGRRDNFLRKEFKGNIKDKCSYGLGIVYDLETEDVENELFIYYDKDKQYSQIVNIEKEKDQLLSDISNIDYNSKDFYKLVQKSKLNSNPILVGKHIIDTKKIKRLFLKYKIKKTIKLCINMKTIK